MRAIAAQLDPRLNWEIFHHLSYEFWVYGAKRSSRQRSCQIWVSSCAFFVGQAQVAFLTPADDVASDIAAWLIGEVPLASLAARGAQLEPYAEVLEIDSARWHWLHVRDRIANPRDVLFPLASLISALADSPIASQFYTFSSLNRLCFSASSHYPWVGHYPIVSPVAKGEYSVGGERCTLPEAVDRIESALAQSPVKPFFGSAPHYDIRVFEEILAKQGSSLKPQLVRRGLWSNVLMVNGSRECTLSSDSVTCREGKERLHIYCASANDVARVAIAFLLEQASYLELREYLGTISPPIWRDW